MLPLVLFSVLGLFRSVYCESVDVNTEQRLLDLEKIVNLLLERVTLLETENEVLRNKNFLTNDEMSQVSIANLVHIDEVNTEGQRLKRQTSDTPIAFTAVVSPPQIEHVGAGQTIIYDTAITNLGGAYHTTTGIFTAPVNGVYVFNFALMVDPGHDEYLDLVKDGQHIMFNYAHGSGSPHLVSASRTAAVQLNKGNEVWVRSGSGASHGTGVIHGYEFTTFSGWLISELE